MTREEEGLRCDVLTSVILGQLLRSRIRSFEQRVDKSEQHLSVTDVRARHSSERPLPRARPSTQHKWSRGRCEVRCIGAWEVRRNGAIWDCELRRDAVKRDAVRQDATPLEHTRLDWMVWDKMKIRWSMKREESYCLWSHPASSSLHSHSAMCNRLVDVTVCICTWVKNCMSNFWFMSLCLRGSVYWIYFSTAVVFVFVSIFIFATELFPVPMAATPSSPRRLQLLRSSAVRVSLRALESKSSRSLSAICLLPVKRNVWRDVPMEIEIDVGTN